MICFHELDSKNCLQKINTYEEFRDVVTFLLKDEIYSWIAENKVQISQKRFSYYSNRFTISNEFDLRFKNEKDEILFKLTWL